MGRLLPRLQEPSPVARSLSEMSDPVPQFVVAVLEAEVERLQAELKKCGDDCRAVLRESLDRVERLTLENEQQRLVIQKLRAALVGRENP